MRKSQIVILAIILILALLFRLILINNHLHDPHFSIQQDDYATYANALVHGTLNTPHFQPDERLFPGYPVLIVILNPVFKSEILSGFLISLASSILAIYLFWLLTKSLLATAAFAFFPPVWILQSTKVATEPLTVFLLLLGITLYLKKKYLWSGIIIGYAFDVRIIAVCLLLALLWHLNKTKAYKNMRLMLWGFVPTALLLFIFNYFFLDKNIFQQFLLYPTIGKATFGVLQIFRDLFRTIYLHQYKILISGLFYVFINLIGVILLYKKRKKSELYSIAFVWMALSLIFIFSIGPTPLLDEFLRFSVPFSPALILSVLPLPVRFVLDLKKKINLNRVF